MAGCSSAVLSFEAEQFLDLQNDFAFYIIIPDALCASVIEVFPAKKGIERSLWYAFISHIVKFRAEFRL